MNNSFRYIKNISTDGEATMLIYSEVGSSIDGGGNMSYGVDGTMFANELQYLQDKSKIINVRINSIGGNVMDGYSIMSAMLASKVPCHTYIDGLAASVSGVIAMCGEKVHMSDYGTLMMHNPSGGNDKGVLNLIKDTLVTVFAGRTALTSQQVSDMMNKETWMNATQAKEAGMVDEIISSGKKVKMSKTTNLTDMVLIYNKLINPNKMNLITNKLGLAEGVEENVIVESIETLQNKNTELQTALDAEKAKVTDMVAENEAVELAKKEAEDAATLAKVDEMVNSLVTAGKVKDTEKESITKLALVDFEAVVNMFSKVGTVKAVKLFDAKNVVVKNGTEDRSAWTIRDWDKKDAKGLLSIRNETPETYKQMYFEFYKVYPQL